MEWNRKKIKQVRDLILFIALIILGLMYSGEVWHALLVCLEMLKPFMIGGMIAFVLNIPMKLIEEKLLGRWRGRAADKIKRPASMLLTLVLVALVVTVFVMAVVPQLGRTINDLANKIPRFLDQTMLTLQELGKEYPEVDQILGELERQEISWKEILAQAVDFMKNGGTVIISSTIGAVSGVIGSLVKGIIAFIFALYILASKEKLQNQGKRILHAFAAPAVEKRTLYIFHLLYQNFSNFFTGQCLEAVILGTIFVVVMSVLRMPYAVMIGVLIAFTALIPIVGAFIGCIVGAFLILVNSPSMALWFVLLFLIIQQIEGNVIYPKVVGESVGLPAIWVLVAVSVGGSLFGVVGMLVFIPLVSTGYMLLKETVNERNRKKAQIMRKEGKEKEAEKGAAAQSAPSESELEKDMAVNREETGKGEKKADHE